MEKQVAHKTTKPQRLECPVCSKSLMIMHKRTLLEHMRYTCPACLTTFETDPPRDPPKQPTHPPTGGTFPTVLRLSNMTQDLRKAA